MVEATGITVEAISTAGAVIRGGGDHAKNGAIADGYGGGAGVGQRGGFGGNNIGGLGFSVLGAALWSRITSTVKEEMT